jgi:hypothetical protein
MMFMLIFIYLHALHFVINVMFLCVYMFCTYLAWLFYILNDVYFSFHVNASRTFFFLQSCVKVVFKHDCGP